MINPKDTVLVIKHDGKEIGRIAAIDPNASDYMTELTRHYGELTVDYVEDKTFAMVSRLFSSRPW